MADASTESEPIVIDGEQTIKNAAALQGVLKVALERGAPVSIDAGSLQTVDTAALQLLTAFANSMRKQDAALTWVSVSDRLREPAERLGLAECLDLDAASDDGDDLLPVF